MNLKLLNNHNAVIYARVCTESIYTKKESITNQVDYLLEYAKENDFNIVNIYSDDGISGGTLKRPGLEEMLSDMKNKKFDTILVANLSRFSRSYIDAGNYLDHIFPENNIRFIATGDNYDSVTYDDEESFAIKIWLNDMYLKDIGNKIRFANQKRSETKYMSAGGIYGFKKNENGEFEINEEEAKVVKLIYKLRLDGLSPYQIRDYLEENKIYSIAYNHYLKTGQRRYMGKRSPEELDKYGWNVPSIKRILTSKEYNGYAVNCPFIIKNGVIFKNENPVEIPNALPKIIDDETFNKVQAYINHQVCFKRTSPIDRLDFVKCINGHSLRYNANSGFYQCRKCHKQYIKGENLNKVLEDDIKKLINEINKNPDKVKEAMGIVNSKSQECDFKTLNQKKKKLDLEIQALFEKYITEEITEDDYNNLLAKYNNQNKEYESKINDFKTNQIRLKPLSKNFRLFVEKIKKIKVNYTEEDLSIFKELIEEVVIEKLGKNKFNIKIKYKM